MSDNRSDFFTKPLDFLIVSKETYIDLLMEVKDISKEEATKLAHEHALQHALQYKDLFKLESEDTES